MKNIFCGYVSFSCLLYCPRLHKTYLLLVENVVFSDFLVIVFFTDSLTGLHFMNSNRQVTKAWVCGLSLVGTKGSNAAGVLDVFCECCVFSDRGLCCKLISRPEESCRAECVCV